MKIVRVIALVLLGFVLGSTATVVAKNAYIDGQKTGQSHGIIRVQWDDGYTCFANTPTGGLSCLKN